jgi:hypothetical protein
MYIIYDEWYKMKFKFDVKYLNHYIYLLFLDINLISDTYFNLNENIKMLKI